MTIFKRQKRYEYKFFRGANGQGALWTIDEVQALLAEHSPQGWRLVKWEGALIILEREQ